MGRRRGVDGVGGDGQPMIEGDPRGSRAPGLSIPFANVVRGSWGVEARVGDRYEPCKALYLHNSQ
jgi:hypothetical protein